MNEDIREKIAFAQSVISLGRDLILILIVIFATLIAATGGDPKKLTEFDWAILVGSSMLLVTGPVFGFYLLKLIYIDPLKNGLSALLYLDGDSPNVPRMQLFWHFGFRGLSPRDYVEMWKDKRNAHIARSKRWFFRVLYNFKLRYMKFNLLILGKLIYLYTFIFFIGAVGLFVEVLSDMG